MQDATNLNRLAYFVAVVDAGRLVNPAVARQQVEGGLIFGLAAAVGATTDYAGGIATARKLGQLGLPAHGLGDVLEHRQQARGEKGPETGEAINGNGSGHGASLGA